jgi:guanylate kinase
MSSAPIPHPDTPLLIVLSGLSGVGKDAVLNGLRRSGLPLEFIVTVTTRRPRPTERDGVHYHFVSAERFRGLIEEGELLEWANVYGNRYGTPRQAVRAALAAGRDVIVKVDVQGAASIKKIVPQAVFIFLATPSLEELARRLRRRRTESPADLELRLRTAEAELEKLHLFDYIVFNRRGNWPAPSGMCGPSSRLRSAASPPGRFRSRLCLTSPPCPLLDSNFSWNDIQNPSHSRFYKGRRLVSD